MNKKTTIRAALIQQMLDTSSASIFISIFIALLLVYMQSRVIASSIITLWLSIFLLVTIARSIMIYKCRHKPITRKEDVEARLLKFRAGVLASASIWGAAGYFLFPVHDPSHQMFLIFIIAGLTSGAVISFAADKLSAHGFTVVVLLPLIVRIWLEGSDLSMTMTIAVIFFLLYILMIGRHITHNMIENVKLRILAAEREDEARSSEQRYRLIINHAPVGIFHYDTNLIITYCNNRFAEILHNSPENLIQLDMKKLKDQVTLPALKKPLSGELGYYEGPYKPTLTAGSIWVSMTCAPTSNADGEIIGGVALIQDITDIQQSHEKISSLLNSMAEGAYGFDLNGHCTFVNRAFLNMLGYQHADEVIGKVIHDLIHHSHTDGSDYPMAQCRIHFTNNSIQEIHAADEVFWRKDGSSIPVEYWAQPVFENDALSGAIVTFIDISERIKAMHDLRESEERFRQMFERHSAIMLLTDPGLGLIVDANPAAADFYGYPLELLRGMQMNTINAHSDLEIKYELDHKNTQQRNHFIFEHRLANGETRAVEVYSSPVYFAHKELFFSIIHDITERRLVEEKIRNFAFYDALTKLPNRRLLYNRLEQSLLINKKSEQFGALIFLDLDKFKPLNDTYGHKVGDLLLIEVAQRLRACIRDTDTAARFGGDEFVVMLSELDTDPANASNLAGLIAEKIRIALSRPYLLTIEDNDNNDLISVEYHCSASIGVVIFNHTDHREEILRRADMAMYKAKESGRNRFVLNNFENDNEGLTER